MIFLHHISFKSLCLPLLFFVEFIALFWLDLILFQHSDCSSSGNGRMISFDTLVSPFAGNSSMSTSSKLFHSSLVLPLTVIISMCNSRKASCRKDLQILQLNDYCHFEWGISTLVFVFCKLLVGKNFKRFNLSFKNRNKRQKIKTLDIHYWDHSLNQTIYPKKKKVPYLQGTIEESIFQKITTIRYIRNIYTYV